MDWLDLLAVQRTLKSLLQHHSSKASILWRSAFLTVQLSHPYMSTGKTTALIRWTFVGKVMSLLLNMLSRLVITFLPRSKHLLISWLQSPSAVILEPPLPQIKSDTISTISPSISHEVMVGWAKSKNLRRGISTCLHHSTTRNFSDMFGLWIFNRFIYHSPAQNSLQISTEKLLLLPQKVQPV